MGQTIGKVRLQPGFVPFVNLPKSIVTDLRGAVVEVSESGYSITLKQLEQIIQLSLHEYLSDEKVFDYSNALFDLLSADALPGCDEIDLFEVLGTLCLVSGMTLEEKVQYLFDFFDFCERGELSMNEVSLAFRSIVSGARKITLDAGTFTNEDIDQVALEAFALDVPDRLKFSPAMVDDNKLTREQFFDYVFNCPEVVSFINHYNDIIAEEEARMITTDEREKQTFLRITANEGAGDQGTKVQSTSEPWRDQLRFLKPDTSDERVPPPPMDALSLEFVCGQNSDTGVVCTSDGDILYAAGSMVVKLVADDDILYKQEFFNEHSNRVASLDIFKMHDGMGDMVASGETDGEDCKICVWSSTTLSSLVTFRTIHKNGVSNLCFSPSGELILTLGGNCMDSLIGVYKWRERRLLFASKIPGLGFYSCSFLHSDNSFGICCEQAVHFWTKSRPHEPYRHHRGATNLFPSKALMTSIACVDNAVVTGSTSGTLWLWEGRVCVKRVQEFRSPITGLFANKVGLAVSAQDGTIHLFNTKLEMNRRLDPTSRPNVFDHVFWEPDRKKLVVKECNNCIREIDLTLDEGSGDSKYIISGHSTLTDFDILKDNIITVGEDGFIRVWDKEVRVMIQQHCLVDRKLSCIACRQADKQLAVGFCRCKNDSANKTDIAFVILYGNDLTKIIHRGYNSQNTLTVCKYSNDGKLLAFGSEDCSIYIHSTDKDFPLIAKGRGHSSPILAFDFGCNEGSYNASFLRSNSINGEALFWSTHAKKQTPLSQRQTRWETQSCIYSWCLEGAHDLYAQESNIFITACCPLATANARSIVVGDSRGSLRVFSSHPVSSKESWYLEFTGHHKSIRKIALYGNSLYTLDKEGSLLCKWKLSSLSWPHEMPPSANNETSINHDKKKEKLAPISLDFATAQMKDLDFNISHKDKASVSYKSLRPWMLSIVPPSSYKPQLCPLPDGSLVLERVHGYNGGGVKNNIHYISKGARIVYSVGKTLIQYDEEGETQRFCHVDGEIQCLAIHEERSICAIGQNSAEHGIIVVDLKAMNYIWLCKSAAKKGIRCLDFDESGRYLVVLEENRLVVQDIENESIVASTFTHAKETLDVRFAKKSKTLFECGKNFVRRWFIKGGVMRFEEADMSILENPMTFYSCIGWTGNDLLVGTSTGNIIRFGANTPISKVKAHATKITNISSAKDGRFAISAAHHVKVYDMKMRCIIAIDTEMLGVRHQITSLCWEPETRRILIGTVGNNVFEISSDDGSRINKGPLFSSHASSPMAIAANPNGTTFATVGDDGFLRVWDPFNHDETSSFNLTMPSRACAFSPDGRMIAVGMGKPVKDSAKTVNGKWVIIDVMDSSGYRIISERRDSRAFIREIKWHSNGDRLAVGSDKIYLYKLTTDTIPAIRIDVSLLSTIELTSPAIQIDFSKDDKYLRVNCEANELMWFESDSAIRIKEASLMRDVEWETHTCFFDWNVQGIHQNESKVKALDCCAEGCSSIVTGGDDGLLRLYSYPCTSTRSNYLSYTAHDGPIASVRTLKGGSHVVSTGERDHAVMIWRHEIDDNYNNSLLNFRADQIPVIDMGDGPKNLCVAFYDAVDQIVHPSSEVCIVLDAKRRTRNLFQGHDIQIGAVAKSESRKLLASGDNGGDNPIVMIWDPLTCTEIAVLSDSRMRGISELAFSPDEKKLAIVCSDHNHNIFVWRTINGSWSDAYMSAHSLGGHEKICFLQFTQTHLVAGGKNLNFWSFFPNLSVSKGVLSAQCQGETFLCGAVMGDKLVTGTSGGRFVTWGLAKREIIDEFKAHNNCSITSLCNCPEGVISASSEGHITIWSSDMQKIRTFDVGFSNAIHSLDIRPHSDGQTTVKVLAVSESKCVYELSCITGRCTHVLTGSS